MNSAAPTTAAAVANEFLALQEMSPDAPTIDPMKLQKLLFYAHAWYLALNDGPLFEEDIEAWPWGPVVRNLYIEFRSFGNRPIVGKKATVLKKTGPGVLDFQFIEPAAVGGEVKSFLQQIWEVHKNFTGVQLSNSTHAEKEPWTIIKEKYGDLAEKPTIPNSLISDVFKAKVDAVAA